MKELPEWKQYHIEIHTLENSRHCGVSLTEYTRRTWSYYMHLHDCHQNVAEPQAAENHIDDKHTCTQEPVADLEGVPWVPWNPPFAGPPLFLLLIS